MTPAQRLEEEILNERNKVNVSHLKGILYFTRPVEVTTLPDRLFTNVYAASHYCYAHCAETNELYSWG